MEAGKRASVDLSEDDLLAINNALNEICHGPEAIPEWEFQTRIGVDRSSAERTLQHIQAFMSGS